MKHLTQLWAMFKLQIGVKTDKEAWALFRFNSNSMRVKRVGDKYKESVIRVAFKIGLDNAIQCKNKDCAEILPDEVLILENITTFKCPECGAVVSDSAEEKEVPPYRLATKAEKFDGLSVKLLNGDGVSFS